MRPRTGHPLGAGACPRKWRTRCCSRSRGTCSCCMRSLACNDAILREEDMHNQQVQYQCGPRRRDSTPNASAKRSGQNTTRACTGVPTSACSPCTSRPRSASIPTPPWAFTCTLRASATSSSSSALRPTRPCSNRWWYRRSACASPTSAEPSDAAADFSDDASVRSDAALANAAAFACLLELSRKREAVLARLDAPTRGRVEALVADALRADPPPTDEDRAAFDHFRRTGEVLGAAPPAAAEE